MGRPPKKPEDRRNSSVIGKVTADECRIIEEWAKFAGKTVSDFVRDTMLEKCREMHHRASSGVPIPAPPSKSD